MVSPFVLNELDSHIQNMDLSTRAMYRAKILAEIFKNQHVSRNWLETHLKLRRGTISSVLREFVEIGVVKELKSNTSIGQGRPRILLSPNPNRFVVLSFYIEGLRLRGGVVNFNEDILLEDEVFVHQQASGKDFENAFLSLWDNLRDKIPEGAEIISGAFSPIGCVKSAEKLWISTNRWQFIKNVNFSVIENRIGCPVVLRRNLETVLAYEISRNPEYAKSRTVLVHWGYGIGSAYAYNGEVLRTERGTYTGVGHIQVNQESKKKCQCGDYGCLEAESALWSMLPCIQKLQVQDPEEAVDQPDILSLLSPDEHPCFRSALYFFGLGVKILCKLFSPDHILFLSPLSENRFVIDLLNKSVAAAFPQSFKYNPSINMVGTTFHSCLYANVHPIIKNKLEDIIRTDPDGSPYIQKN